MSDESRRGTSAPGYVRDTPYTAEYFEDLHPARLYLTALVNGHVPPFDPDAPRYCELGCGNGMTLNLLAAALPHGDFVGIDFNPAHIARARSLAERAGLTNVRFLEADFGVADERLGEACFDIIATHGVYSWVDERTRCALEGIAARRLDAGGLFHVSYNALPRWAPAEPARKLIHEFMAARPDPADGALQRALGLYDQFRATNSGWFEAPGETVDRLLGDDQRAAAQWFGYAVHEYGGTEWSAWYHCDVRRRIEGGGVFAFVGSGDLARAWPDAGGTSAIEEHLSRIEEPGLRETLRDYMVQPLLRHDLYARGRIERASHVRLRAIDERRVALVVDPGAVAADIDLPIGRVRLDEARLARLLDHLHPGGIDTIGNLVGAMGPADGRDDDGGISRRLVLLLCRSRVLQPAVAAAATTTPEAGCRFNRSIAERARDRTPFGALLAEEAGVGCPAGSLAQLVWRASADGVGPDADAIADHLREREGVRLRGEAAGAGSGDDRTAMRAAVARVVKGELPRLPRVSRHGGDGVALDGGEP